MPRKNIGIVFFVLGLVLLVVSLTADWLGIGNVPGFGVKQILGSIAGAMAAILGAWLALKKAGRRKQN
jgi:hypothetical protein